MAFIRLEFSTLDGQDQSETEHEKAILKKLFYNVSQAGLNIPVQVIYDSPDHFIKALVPKPAANYNRLSSDASSDADPQTPTVPVRRPNGTRRDRNSRWRQLSLAESNDQDGDQYYLAGEDLASKPVSIELKSINRTQNPFAFVVSRPEFFQRLNNTKKKVPFIFQLLAPTKNEYNDTIIEKIDHKFIAPILDKLAEMNSHRHPQPNPPPEAQIPSATAPTPVQSAHAVHNRIVPHHHYPEPMPLYSGYPSAAYVPNPYPSYPVAQYYPYDLYRQWSSPFANYFPMVVRDPFRAALNYFSDPVEYGPAADLCHGRTGKARKDEETNNDDDHSAERQTEPNFEFGKRRYDDSPTIEYVDHQRPKRNTGRKDVRRYTTAELRRRQTTEAKEPPPAESTVRATDVGPQISKLIVRRGGVAIAGAGGIATAGSGGTAIVGPGGTAFTTPASSGGVAMVGPGGKVVKVPDITNVLYGRTAPLATAATQVAATGAGHATFTNKHGEVFTTSDQTGGVALVNPGGGVLGVADDQDLDEQNRVSKTQAKEVQLPPGARLLTTGPIIYYNPVYPMNQLR